MRRTTLLAALSLCIIGLSACGGGGPERPLQPLGENYWVDANFGSDDQGLGSEASPWRTVTRALNAALSGDTIHVKPGTYDVALGEVFPIVLHEGVRIVGDETTKGVGAPGVGGMSRLIIGSGNLPYFLPGYSLPVAVVLRSDTSLSGVMITNPEANQDTSEDPFAGPTGVLVSGDGASLHHVTVQGCAFAGIFVDYQATNSTVASNHALLNQTGVLNNSSWPTAKFEFNRVESNIVGVLVLGPIDLGGGVLGSSGQNILRGNTTADVRVRDPNTSLSAANNIWDGAPPASHDVGNVFSIPAPLGIDVLYDFIGEQGGPNADTSGAMDYATWLALQ